MDKSLGVTLMVLFGLSGVAAGVLCWIWPLSTTERFMDTIIAAMGVGVAVVAGFRSFPLRRERAAQPVEVHQR